MEMARDESKAPPMPNKLKKQLSLCKWLLLSVLLSACLQQAERQEPLQEKKFFNLNNYFEKEAERLQQSNRPWLKIAQLNEKKETLKVSNINWQKELEIFSRCDLNKPAWKEKYKIDTTFLNGDLSKISYISTDDELLIKKINITFSTSNKPDSIQIRKETHNFLMSMEQDLHYNPNTGYKIEQREKMLGFKPSYSSVELRFSTK